MFILLWISIISMILLVIGGFIEIVSGKTNFLQFFVYVGVITAMFVLLHIGIFGGYNLK